MPELAGDPLLLPLTLVCDRSTEENGTANWRSFRPAIESGKCTGCGLCWKYCPEACVSLTAKVPVIDLVYCKGCGICVKECPPKCITFTLEAER